MVVASKKKVPGDPLTSDKIPYLVTFRIKVAYSR